MFAPGLTYRYYAPEPLGLPPPVFTFGEGYSYTTFSASDVLAPPSVGPCDDIPITVTVTNTGTMDSDVVVQVGRAVCMPVRLFHTAGPV